MIECHEYFWFIRGIRAIFAVRAIRD